MLYEKARPYISMETQKKLQNIKWEVQPRPPFYSFIIVYFFT